MSMRVARAAVGRGPSRLPGRATRRLVATGELWNARQADKSRLPCLAWPSASKSPDMTAR
eukprot:5447293-Alexandrium_andersonii.AAC.1